MFNILFIVLIMIILLICFYNVYKLKQFKFINSIKNKILQWLTAILPIGLLLISFNYVNFLVIIIHLAIFFFLATLFVYLIKKLLKKEPKFYLVGILAIGLTIVYLGIGAYLDYHVVETKYTITTNKEIGNKPFRIIQISDSHIGTTFNGEGFYEHMKKISEINADLLVITGDFVDDDTTLNDMIKSCESFSLIKPKYGTYFIYGNHDKGYFNYRNFSDLDLRRELTKNNVIILEDEIKEIGDYFYLIGRKDKSNSKRKTIDELIKNLDKDKYIIDLNHQPNDYNNEKNKVDLVLSGHTHGGQLFPLGYIGLLTKSNDEFYGLHKRDNTNFIITSGISDWAVDFKTGTKSEYVIIEINKVSQSN